jgi:hypothetical protein
MFLHLVRVQHRTDRECDFGRAAQRIAPARHSGLDTAEAPLGRRQQVLTRAGAFSGEVGIAADTTSRSPGKSGDVMLAISR